MPSVPVVAPVEEDLTAEECEQLLRTAAFGRVGVSIAALPAVVPVNFLVDDGDVVFRTVPGTRFDVATARTVVAFEVDEYDPATGTGWSVLVQGMTREVADKEDKARLRSLGLPSWAAAGDADRFVRIAMDVVTGRRLVTA